MSPRGATQSRSFDRRHRGRLRPPVRDRSWRRRAAPIDWLANIVQPRSFDDLGPKCPTRLARLASENGLNIWLRRKRYPFRRLGLLIAIHSETALAQTTLVPSSYVAEENYLYCNPASNGDKRHGDFRPDLDHEPDIYPVLGLPLAPPASMLFGFLAVASCDKTSRAMAVLRTLAASWRSHAHQASSPSPVQADR